MPATPAQDPPPSTPDQNVAPAATPPAASSSVQQSQLWTTLFGIFKQGATEIIQQTRDFANAADDAPRPVPTTSTLAAAQRPTTSTDIVEYAAAQLREIADSGIQHTPYAPPELLCDSATGQLFTNTHRLTDQVAKYQAMRKLRLMTQDIPSQYVGGESGTAPVPIDAPAIAKCKLTGKLIQEAVVTPDGTICDKQALLQYLKKYHRDPITGNNLVALQLHDFPDLTARIATYRKKREEQYAARFRFEYRTAFEQTPFWRRNPFSTMRWKIRSQPQLSFEDALTYSEAHPKTRTSVIMRKLRKG